MDPNELTRRLLSAAPDSTLGPTELLLLLRNGSLPSDVLTTIAAEPRWTARSTIRRALVLHRNTPLATARNLVPFLFWRDLVDVATAPHVDAVVRRHAERRLLVCLEEMTVGELISFARVAPRALVPQLAASRQERVIRSVLGNPRIVEAEVVAIARRASSTVAGFTAHHPRWGGRRDVRLTLAKNPNTPVDIALRIVMSLDARDAGRLVPDGTVPKLVRVAAQRRAEPARALARGGRA